MGDMEFKLNEYHRNISDNDLIQDVRKTAEKLGKPSLSRREYNENEKYYSSTLEKRFGSKSWKLRTCEL